MRAIVTVVLINKQLITLPHGGLFIEGEDRNDIVARALNSVQVPSEEYAFCVVWRERVIGTGPFVSRLATGTVPKAA